MSEPQNVNRMAGQSLFSLVAALLLMAGSGSSAHAPRQPANFRCANSPMITGDIFRAGNRSETIATISKISSSQSGEIVGWAYDTTDGVRFAQVTSRMSEADRSAARIFLRSDEKLSGLRRITASPWSDLKITRCTAAEMKNAEDVHFDPRQI